MRGCESFIVSAKSLKDIKIPKGKGIQHLPILQNVAVKHVEENSVSFLTTDLETAGVKRARPLSGKFL